MRRLDRAFAPGRLATVKTPCCRFDCKGGTWLSGSFVQLTHGRNYQAMSTLTGIDLVADTCRAMQMGMAVEIMIGGMRARVSPAAGLPTIFRRADYFSPGRTDWFAARKFTNGTDCAARVAGYA